MEGTILWQFDQNSPREVAKADKKEEEGYLGQNKKGKEGTLTLIHEKKRREEG